ncbi:hypothetical protein ACJQWK_05907 [Exserohilum turcicum]|uniref:DUF202 domain-containing protein n=1 Tax=Exserohilum turcicum (strain 28A) TaxID=671987 RepID=R0JZT2_EXST2|nr:uncharacterized protein SETTUDRAFT_109666 [Exserohilum turcica Et28A]EOA86403.1 hypothetical protein SETTUDRAFT_109666 [Exserohilum turcica Et28A]
MSDPTSSRAPPLPPLNLPSAALHIHSSTRSQLHPDSEDAVRFERQRFAKELEPVRRNNKDTTPSEAHAPPSFASLRSRGASANSVRSTSRDDLRRYASTQADVDDDTEHGDTPRSKRFYDALVTFWTTQISLSIDEGAQRDHLALERTFLGYLRTSLLLVMTGIIIAQLFIVQHSPTPKPFGFHRIGRPLSATFICLAIVVLIIGALRFWRLQRALVGGKALAGGWEVSAIMGLVTCLLLGTFGLILGVDIEKTYFGG